MDRRSFLLGTMAAVSLSNSASAHIGHSASPQLINAFESVFGIREGSGGGTLHILYAPWCHISPRIYKDSRGVVSSGRLRLKWIPFSGGQPEGSIAVEKLLWNPVATNIPSTFMPIQSIAQRGPTPRADQQDHEVMSRLESLVIRDSGRGLVTPTLAYRMGDRVRLLPGGISASDMDVIAGVAS